MLNLPGPVLKILSELYTQKNYSGFIQQILKDHTTQRFLTIPARLTEIGSDLARSQAPVPEALEDFKDHTITREEGFAKDPAALNKNLDYLNSWAPACGPEQSPAGADGRGSLKFLTRRWAAGDRFVLVRMLRNREIQNKTFASEQAGADFFIRHHKLTLP